MISKHELDSITKEIQKKLTKKNEIVVYTVIFKNYDVLHAPQIVDKKVDYICITDHFFLAPYPWKLIIIKSPGNDNTRLNRFLKINTHLIFKDYKKSLYIDGNVIINCFISEFADLHINNFSMKLIRHPFRNCIYTEAPECIRKLKDDSDIISKQMNKYRAEGFPEYFGLSENNILLRNHNDSELIEVMTSWWQEVNNKSKRDQLSFFYSIWKNKYPVTYYDFPISIRTKNHKLDPHYSFFVIRHMFGNRTRFKRMIIIIYIYITSFSNILKRNIDYY